MTLPPDDSQTQNTKPIGLHARFVRPLIVSIAMCVVGEAFLLGVFGMWQFPDGSLTSKVVWTLGLCGIGMGVVIGTLISLLVMPRWDGLKAIAACTVISLVTLGIGCNLLCFAIDRHFNYFGALDQPALWLGSGVALSILGGVLSGTTLFTRSGRALLTMVHL